MSSIIVPQPLHSPAPFVAYGTNPGKCYSDPVLVSEYVGGDYEAADFRSYTSLDYCGKMVQYTPCDPFDSDVVVLYETVASPHPFVLYGPSCYAFAGTVTSAGTRSVVMADAVSPVTSCADPVCTLADPVSSTFAYFDSLTGVQTNVHFEHLDGGTPNFGVGPARTDADGIIPEPGHTLVRLTRGGAALFLTVAGTGLLRVTPGRTLYSKTLVRVRGGATVNYPLGPYTTYQDIPVEPGDRLFLDMRLATGRLAKGFVGARVPVSWTPIVAMPRLYDTIVFDPGGARVISALGFCGRTAREPYAFYDALPASGNYANPANPGGIVTVQGNGDVERLLINHRITGAPDNQHAFASYAGTSLANPMTFRFYAHTRNVDGHGEMDVWTDVDGTLPAYLGVDAARVLVYTGSSYARTAEALDVRRSELTVLPNADSNFLPAVYVALDGELRTVQSQAGSVVLDGKSFARVVADPGLSHTIYTV